MFGFEDEIARSGQKINTDVIHSFFNAIGRLTRPVIDDFLYTLRIKHEDLILKFDTTESFAIPAIDAQDDTQIDMDEEKAYLKLFKPAATTIRVYTLTHTETGTFAYSNTGKKFGAITTLDETQYLKLSPQGATTRMDMGTGDFGFAFWLNKVGGNVYCIFCKRDISAATNAGIDIYVQGQHDNTFDIRCRISDGTNTTLMDINVAINFTLDAWHSVIINVPASGNLELFVDTVSEGTVARGSVTGVNNTRDAYVFAADNAGVLQDEYGGDFAWFHWKKELFSSQDRTDFHTNGIMDMTGTDVEVTTIPFMGNTKEQIIAQLGGFNAN